MNSEFMKEMQEKVNVFINECLEANGKIKTLKVKTEHDAIMYKIVFDKKVKLAFEIKITNDTYSLYVWEASLVLGLYPKLGYNDNSVLLEYIKLSDGISKVERFDNFKKFNMTTSRKVLLAAATTHDIAFNNSDE